MCTCGHSVFAHPHDGPCVQANCSCAAYQHTAPDLMAALKDSLEPQLQAVADAGRDTCWDCKHPTSAHSGSYPNWDKRGIPKSDWPPKRPDEGCTVPGCTCRRWFETA